ncbi:MAG: aldo/keto reductase [Clostridiales bacterium]|jgi:predicted aldo/keto reductase-like oxidoreductase|nr:aldo/keto reductase [Clostridiales bacterium]
MIDFGSKLGFGTLRLPSNSDDPADINYDEVSRMADAFLAGGGRYFECAYHYCGGNVEIAARKALSERHSRDEYDLADKMPVNYVYQASQYERIFNDQLKKCGVDYFDAYLLHNIGGQTYERTAKLGGFEYLKSLKERGLAKLIGFSFHDTAETLERILAAHHKDIDFVQLQINYLDWLSPAIQSKKCLETATRYGLPVFVMEPLKGGKLTTFPQAASISQDGLDPVSLALKFAASQEGVALVLSGMSNTDEVKSNLKVFASTSKLTDQELIAIEKVNATFEASKQIQCTKCGYCLPVCPKKIPIPAIFDLYNGCAQVQETERLGKGHFRFLYERLTETQARAESCIKCGKCESVCSQLLPIRANLELSVSALVVKPSFKARIKGKIRAVLSRLGLLDLIMRLRRKR